jgi:hypothetical protein
MRPIFAIAHAAFASRCRSEILLCSLSAMPLSAAEVYPGSDGTRALPSVRNPAVAGEEWSGRSTAEPLLALLQALARRPVRRVSEYCARYRIGLFVKSATSRYLH